MAMSKKQKRKNKANTRAAQIAYQAESMKTYTGGGYGYFGSSSISADMRADEWGASQAYTFNVAVSAAIEFWELWLDGIQWRICSEADDRVLIDSNMRRFPRAIDGGKFAHAIKFHEQCFKHSLFKSMAFSDMMYGESYIHFIPNDWGLADKLEWMNPLAVEPNIMQGRIRDYRYSADEGYQTLSPKEVAYRIAKRDSQNDLRGQSRVLAAIDALNLEANQKRSLKSYFKNGMNLGGLISPTDPNASLGPAQVQQLEDNLERKHKGAGNAGKMAIAPSNMQIEMFPAVDIQDNYNIIKPLRDEILMAMGVYPQLAGDPSDANYDSAYDIKRQWWETRGIPYAKEIEGFINDLILPILEPYTNVYFEFDFTPYEVEKPEVVSADFAAGFVDMYDAAELRGYEGDEQLKGIYMINNLPMSKDIILKLANTIPSQYALDYANAATAGQPANANADTALGIAKPITPALPSGNVQSSEGAAISREYPELDYPLEVLEKAVIERKKSLESLPTLDDGTPIVEAPFPATLNSAHDGIPDDIHHSHGLGHDVVSMIVDSSDVSELDELAAWKALYAPAFDEIDAFHKFYMNGKHHKRDFVFTHLKQNVYGWIQRAIESGDKQEIIDEFRKAYSNVAHYAQHEAFKPVALRGDIGDALQLAVDSHDKQAILDAFKAAFDKLSVKAIQATRLSFEGDFDELLTRARKEKMGRVQWASAMRSVLRRYGTRAYIDGLTDGGVEDELSDDDRITINELVAEQSGYVTELGNVLYKGEGISDAQSDIKAALWFNKSVMPLYQAGLQAADFNGVYEWVYGDTEHCTDCKRLNGQRHRLKGWKANWMPQSDRLDCGGFNCKCTLQKVKGKVRGSY